MTSTQSASEGLRLVITGVTRGLGRALTQRLDAMGHTVIGCGRSTDALESLRQSVDARHHFTAVNVADADEVASWAEAVLDRFEAPDYLLNNAAIINRNARLWQIEPDEFSRLIDINIKGVMYVTRAFLPAMIERGQGVVVNFSSGWGHSTSPLVAPYCASKFAIEGMTRALAQELPDGLAAIPLSPGVIHTDMLDTAFGAAAAEHPNPTEWAVGAAEYILALGPEQNGESLRVPQ